MDFEENNDSFFGGKINLNDQEETQEETRAFPLYNAHEEVESFIDLITQKNENLKDLFADLGHGDSNINLNKKNEIIENIIVELDKIERSYKEMQDALQDDKNTIKGLQVVRTSDLRDFESIFYED